MHCHYDHHYWYRISFLHFFLEYVISRLRFSLVISLLSCCCPDLSFTLQLEEQIHRYKNEHAWTERDLRDCRRLISEYEVSIADLRDREATATNRLLVLQREVLLRDHQMESSDAKYSSVSSSLSEKEDLISQLQMKLKDSVQMFADAEKRAMKAEGEAARLRLALKESQDSLSSSTQLSVCR